MAGNDWKEVGGKGKAGVCSLSPKFGPKNVMEPWGSLIPTLGSESVSTEERSIKWSKGCFMVRLSAVVLQISVCHQDQWVIPLDQDLSGPGSVVTPMDQDSSGSINDSSPWSVAYSTSTLCPVFENKTCNSCMVKLLPVQQEMESTGRCRTGWGCS